MYVTLGDKFSLLDYLEGDLKIGFISKSPCRKAGVLLKFPDNQTRKVNFKVTDIYVTKLQH